MAKIKRTSQGLRDILFDEIEELRSGEGDPQKAVAVAKLARQIISTAEVELEFHNAVQKHLAEGTPSLKLGSLTLGSQDDAASVAPAATEH